MARLPSLTYSARSPEEQPGDAPIIVSGSGSPEGVVAAALSSFYLDLVGTALWAKTDDTDPDPSVGWDQITGTGVIPGPTTLPALLTPAALAAGTTHDYAPAGLEDANQLRLTADAAGSTLTGLQGMVANQVLVIRNISANDLTLEPENAGSLAPNRFAMNGTVILGAKQSVWAVYDGDLLRVCLIGV